MTLHTRRSALRMLAAGGAAVERALRPVGEEPSLSTRVRLPEDLLRWRRRH